MTIAKNHRFSNYPAMNHVHEENLSVGGGHTHSEDSLKQIINRLSRIEGHIRGVKTMVSENRPCPEVLIQIAAVRGSGEGVSIAKT